MLDELLKDINELKEYKKKYEYELKDKQTMSDLLYDYMMKEWECMGREDRVVSYQKNTCSSCKHYGYCNIGLPEDILKPVPSDKAWIPARKNCGKFEWS